MKSTICCWVCAFALLVPRLSAESRKTCEQLVDELAGLSAFTAGLHPTASIEQFLGDSSEPQFQGGILGSIKPTTNDAMRELVRRGHEAIPSLLTRLDDSRPTKLEITSGEFLMWSVSSNAYNNRPLGIDVGYEVKRESIDLPYVVKIGDVCLVILGQITDRPQVGVVYRPTAGVEICSPVIYPEIAVAARADWTNVTEEQFRQHLLTDYRSSPGPTNSALPRIRLYFPELYRSLVGTNDGNEEEG